MAQTPRRRVFIVGIAAWTCAVARTAFAQAGEGTVPLEYRVKAAYLSKFVTYVTWPPSAFAQPDSPLTIGVIGSDPVAVELENAMAGRKINERAVTTRRLALGDPLAGVHVLFIGKSEIGRLTQLAQLAQAQAILTVTEFEGALRQGSVINFTFANRRVRFEISLDSAAKSRLELDSRLLSVAQLVIPGGA